MLSMTTIVYGTTFLATSASLNYTSSIIKSSLPRLGDETLKTIHADLPTYVSYGSAAVSLAVFAASVYTGHYAGMQTVAIASESVAVIGGAVEAAQLMLNNANNLKLIYQVAKDTIDVAHIVMAVANGDVAHLVQRFDVINNVSESYNIFSDIFNALGIVGSLALGYDPEDIIGI